MYAQYRYRRNITEVSFPHLEDLKIRTICDTSSCFSEYGRKLLCANQHLQSLTVMFNRSVRIEFNQLTNMISKNPSILKLSAYCYREFKVHVNRAELMKFASELVMIELYFGSFYLWAADVITFLGQMNSLKKFTFRLENRSKPDHLINQLGNEWQHKVITVKLNSIKTIKNFSFVFIKKCH